MKSRFHDILSGNESTSRKAAEKAFGVAWNPAEETYSEFLSSFSETEARELCEDLGLVAEELSAADVRESQREELRARARFHLTGGR